MGMGNQSDLDVTGGIRQVVLFLVLAVASVVAAYLVFSLLG
jgi:hypothetical protein